jgi:hypothetical protein
MDFALQEPFVLFFYEFSHETLRLISNLWPVSVLMTFPGLCPRITES